MLTSYFTWIITKILKDYFAEHRNKSKRKKYNNNNKIVQKTQKVTLKFINKTEYSTPNKQAKSTLIINLFTLRTFPELLDQDNTCPMLEDPTSL